MANIEKLKQYAAHKKVLLVEDDEMFRETTRDLLALIFDQVDTAQDGMLGLHTFRSINHDLIITDIVMPNMDGIEMISAIKEIRPRQPIIVISGHDESAGLIRLLNMGIENFIVKPFNKEELFSSIEKIMRYNWLKDLEKNYQQQLEDTVSIKTEELSKSLKIIKELSDEIVLRLSTSAEFKDTETGLHIKRLGMYAETMADKMSMDKNFIESIKFGAPLHDIGKIGIPDNILLKPGKLTKEEFETMKTHTHIGAKILKNSNYDKIQMAHSIALTHHEKWDGSGYPQGLTKKNIPIEGRIITICDQYDALRSLRPYKEPISHDEACDIIIKGDGRTLPEHFDPDILDIFKLVETEFNKIFSREE